MGTRFHRHHSLLALGLCALLPLLGHAQGAVPAFATGTPTAGTISGTLYVFVPFSNVGSAAANQVAVTAATLGGQSPTTPILPSYEGMLAPTQTGEIELHFDATRFVAGQRYLLTLRGTYQAGTANLAFTLNRFITVQPFAAGDLPTLQRFESTDAIGEFVDTLPGLDPVQDNQTILAFIQSRPEFVDSGINDTTVWAQFADGHLITIVNGDGPLTPDSSVGFSAAAASVTSNAVIARPSPGAPSASASTAQSLSRFTRATAQFQLPPFPGVPQSSDARLLAGFAEMAPFHTYIGTILEKAHYTVDSLPASLLALRTVGGQGVVLLSTHGAVAPRSPQRYFMSSTDPVDPLHERNDPDAAGDPITGAPPTLIWMHVIVGTRINRATGALVPIRKWRYAISPEFVAKYWTGFDSSSLVLLNACNSSTSGSASFQSAVFHAGVGLIAGWTATVNAQVAADAAVFTFDRLLGADSYCPEDGANSCNFGSAAGADATPPVFAQRPFEWQSVMQDLSLHNVQIPPPGIDCDGLTTCPLSTSTRGLQFNENPAGDLFALLAPSVAAVFVKNEASVGGSDDFPHQSTIIVTGNWGTVPGTVTVSGQPLSDCNWLLGGVECVIPDTGAAASGPVQVLIHDHPSNAAALTMWLPTMNVTVNGPQSMSQSTVINLAFRGDIRKVRATIHSQPIEPRAILDYALPSRALYQCSGQAQYSPSPGETDTYTLSGSGAVTPDSTATIYFAGPVYINSSTSMSLNLGLGASSQYTLCHNDAVFRFPTATETASFDDRMAWPQPDVNSFGTPFPLTLDAGGVINGGVFTATELLFDPFMANSTIKFQWNGAAPSGNSAPDPKSPR